MCRFRALDFRLLVAVQKSGFRQPLVRTKGCWFNSSCPDSPLTIESTMESANFRRALQAFVARRPFKPFRVELASGAQFTVDHPEVLAHRGGVAVFIDARGNYTLFDSTSVTQVTEAPGNGSTRSHR